MNLNERKGKKLPASAVSMERLHEMLKSKPTGKQAAKIRKELERRQKLLSKQTD